MIFNFSLKIYVLFVGLTCSLTIYSVMQSPGSKRSEALLEPRETVVLTSKNVQVFVVCRVCSIHCKNSFTVCFWRTNFI